MNLSLTLKGVSILTLFKTVGLLQNDILWQGFYGRDGHFICHGAHFETVAFSGGSCFPLEMEASR